MAHINATLEEESSEILNEVSDDEEDDIEDMDSLASDDKIDVAPSTSTC